MIAKSGAIDVYFEEEIEILVGDPDEFSASTVGEVLDELEIEYTTIEETS